MLLQPPLSTRTRPCCSASWPRSQASANDEPVLEAMFGVGRRALFGRRSTLLGCSSGLMASAFERSPPSRPRSLESGTRPTSFCTHGADAHAMPQPSAHELPMTGMPSTGSSSAEKARPGSIQSLFYPTAAPRGTPPGVSSGSHSPPSAGLWSQDREPPSRGLSDAATHCKNNLKCSTHHCIQVTRVLAHEDGSLSAHQSQIIVLYGVHLSAGCPHRHRSRGP